MRFNEVSVGLHAEDLRRIREPETEFFVDLTNPDDPTCHRLTHLSLKIYSASVNHEPGVSYDNRILFNFHLKGPFGVRHSDILKVCRFQPVEITDKIRLGVFLQGVDIEQLSGSGMDSGNVDVRNDVR